MRLIDADALEELFREVIGGIAKRPEITKDLEHMVRASAMTIKMIQDAPTIGGWICVKDRLPPEKDTFFARLKGTDKWRNGMFEKNSEDVRVVFLYEDGTRGTGHSKTIDGVWECEKEWKYPKRKVTHWLPNPELPEEEENGITGDD